VNPVPPCRSRDGHPSDPDNIFITNGASDGIGKVATLIMRDSKDGCLVCIPQYPLYVGHR
jgi:alanine transaminase